MKHDMDQDDDVLADTNVPNFRNDMPVPENRADMRKKKYHFDLMKVGDHVSYPASESSRIRPVVTYYKKRMNKGRNSFEKKVDFTSRIVGEEIIFWRIS